MMSSRRRATGQQSTSDAETLNSDDAAGNDSSIILLPESPPSLLTTRDPSRSTASRRTSRALSISSSSTDSIPLASKIRPAKRKRRNSNNTPSADMEERDGNAVAGPSSKKLPYSGNTSVPSTKQENVQFAAREPLSAYSCPICFSPPTNATLTPCGHICCGECLFTAVRTTLQRAYTHMSPDPPLPRCPVCRAVLKGWDGKGAGVIGLKVKTVFSL